LVNFLIQAAWYHAEELGWGVDNLLKKNLVWVLSGIKLEILNYAHWKESVTVDTWPKGVNRLFYLRDFNVKNTTGELIARGTTNWLLIDIDKRRPKLMEGDAVILQLSDMPHAIAELVSVLEFEGTPVQSTDYQVRYSSVDINRHLTTTGYIDYIFDSYDPEFISANRPKSITANFIKEVKFGMNVHMIRSKLSEKKEFFQLISEDGKTVYFKAALIF
jgi:acyl-ACP thioesterase